MKYNININQLALSELSADMDVVDAAILDYIINICRSQSEKIDNRRILDKDGVSWTWVDFRSLLDEMPLLRIDTKGALSRRIGKIEQNEFITTLKKRINGHITLFIKTNRKVDSLFSKSNRPIAETEQGDEKPVAETERIIITSNTIHNSTTSLELFNQFWTEYPLKKAKKYAEGIWLRKINPEIAPMIIEDVKKRKLLDPQWIKDGGMFIPHASTYLNQERWNDEITPIRARTPILPLGTTYTPGKYAFKDPLEITNVNNKKI